MTSGRNQIGERTASGREGRPLRGRRFRRTGLWAALFAVFCQIVVPVGHDPLALLIGERCPGLDLVHGGAPGDIGGGQTSDQANSPQPAAPGHAQLCPIFQSFVYLAPLGSSGPAPLPPPTFSAFAQFPADWAGFVPAGGPFSRPFPRAPPALA